jgi:hypothetical protein
MTHALALCCFAGIYSVPRALQMEPFDYAIIIDALKEVEGVTVVNPKQVVAELRQRGFSVPLRFTPGAQAFAEAQCWSMLATAGGEIASDITSDANATHVAGLPFPWLVGGNLNPVYRKVMGIYTGLADAVGNSGFKHIVDTMYRLNTSPLLNGDQLVEALQQRGITTPPDFAQSAQAAAVQEMRGVLTEASVALISRVRRTDDGAWSRDATAELREVMGVAAQVDFTVAKNYGVNIFPLLIRLGDGCTFNSVYEPCV